MMLTVSMTVSHLCQDLAMFAYVLRTFKEILTVLA